MSRDGRRRPALAAGVCTLLAAALLLLTTSPAGAIPPPPPNPSDQDILDSQSAASSSAAEVGRLSGLVSKTQGDIVRLRGDMELKAELVKKAMIDEQIAEADATDAQADAVTAAKTADAAGSAITDAQQKAADFAAASFRQGSVLGSVTAYLDAGNVGDLLSREQLIQQISANQLDVIANLQTTRNHKANLDSDARVAADQAQAAREKATEAKQAAEAAKTAASDAFVSGQAQLASLQTQLNSQQADYDAAMSKVAGLQQQRQQYEAWLAAKKAEEERLRQEALAQARAAAAAAAAKAAAEQAAAQQLAAEQAAAAKAAKDAAAAQLAAEKAAAAKAAADRAAVAQANAQRAKAARAAAARAATAKAAADRLAAQKAAADRAAQAKAAASQSAADRAAAAKAAAAKAAADRAVRDRAATLAAARRAQQNLANAQKDRSASKYYASCATAEKAGVTPIKKGSPGYRIGLDRNHNGVACERLSDSAANYNKGSGSGAKPPKQVYYASCAAAEAAGVIPIKKGSPGYRIGLDTNGNGIACEILGSSGSGSGGAASSRNNTGSSAPGAWSAAKGQAAVQAAVRWVGTPYSWGGGSSSGPTLGICGPNGAENDCNVVGFDCSGLTSYAWAQEGISIPAYSVYQYTLGNHISMGSLLPGDLLFYANDTTDPSTIHHVTMYMGNGQMVEAPYSGAYVHVTSADFGNGYIGATRPGT